jgi:hypothetical protein
LFHQRSRRCLWVRPVFDGDRMRGDRRSSLSFDQGFKFYCTCEHMKFRSDVVFYGI